MSYIPGTQEINCPHCGEEIIAKRINKAFENSNDEDILDTCLKCGRFIRKSHLTLANNQEKEQDSGWVEGICWFCETRQAEDNFKAHVFLTKDETSTFTGFSTRTEGKLTTVYIPRCSQCKKNQLWKKWSNTIATILFFPAMFGTIYLMIALSSGALSNSAGAFLFLVFCIIEVLILIMIRKMLTKIYYPDSPRTKDIGRKSSYPQVKALEKEGWKAQIDSQIG